MYQITKSEEILRNLSDSDIEEENLLPKESIVEINLVKSIEIPDEFLINDEMDNGKLSSSSNRSQINNNTLVFGDVDKKDNSKWKLHLDNQGNVVFINEKHKLMMLNDKQVWDNFHNTILSTKKSIDQFSIVKFGQGAMVLKTGESIYWLSYSKNEFSKPKLLSHKVFSSNEHQLVHIVLPPSSRHVILIYNLNQVTTIVIWDVISDMEHANFLAREGDVMTDYLVSNNKIMKNPGDYNLGYVCFIQHSSEELTFKDLYSLCSMSTATSHYIVDLNTGVPNPFIKVDTPTEEYKWGQGTRISRKGDLILSCGSLITLESHLDAWYNQMDSDGKRREIYLKYFVSFFGLRFLGLLYWQEIDSF